ncbi:phosphoenolpyruvate--protein phosphotransferase [Cellulomonas endometrii]|uniref:phosphoenolpyruvate--protein phosphotransferase n=1 Tax=Cellulomonas endometrii TaxID=3036301 RepID=UPI003D15A8E6
MTLALRGVGVSPGTGAGMVLTMPAPVAEPPAASLPAGADPEAAVAAIEAATAGVQADLTAAAATASGTAAEVLTVAAAMAADPALAADAGRRVRSEGRTPERAVWEAAAVVIDQLAALGGYMAERTRDVADIRDRVVARLTDVRPPGVPDPGHPFVLVARDLAPADTATLDPGRVVAIVTVGGGPTSHTAILARSLGIPAVVAAPDAADLVDGETVVVDGSAGVLLREPTAEDLAAADRARSRRDRAFTGVGATADGHHVQLLANVADPSGAQAAADAGAEGVGLFRTEFCFLGRTEEPSVEEQVRAYRTVLAAFGGKKVVVRTLDAGADKPLPFVTAEGEPNPALGVRGLRTAVKHPEVLDRQLDAIAQAASAESAEVWVMAPMVATPDEAEAFVRQCEAHGLRQAGVMVEVPAAALCATAVLEHARFASLGTNDLTQYAMAADRELADLAPLSTPWQPAVLALVAATCRGGTDTGRPVGVCGEAAADPVLAPVLVGLGVTSLSMTPRALADVAAVLAEVTLEDCRRVAALAVGAGTAEAGRAAVRDALPVLADLGL